MLDAYLFCLGDDKKAAKLLRNVDGDEDDDDGATAVTSHHQEDAAQHEGSDTSSVYSAPILQRSASANSSSYDTT